MANHTKHGRRALEKRQDGADARQEARDARSTKQQLALLSKRPGSSIREIAKLS